MQFQTKYNRPSTEGRTFTQPSLAIPDQTLSLKTLVQKYVRGLPISAPTLSGTFTEDEDAVDFSKLDLADQERIYYERSDELKNLEDTLIKEREEKARKRKEKDEETQKELEELRKLKTSITT